MEKWGYREYRQWILSEMRMYYPPNEGFAVYTQWIEKNNISLEALIIRHVTEQEVPVFYLKDFYGAYRGGVPLQGTAMHICRLYECRRQLRAPFGELSDFGAVKDKLRIHLVEKEGNQRYLEEGPYRILTLGAAIVTAEVLDTPDGKFCARVTEELLRGYGISDDRLFETAMEETCRQEPACFFPYERAVNALGEALKEDLGAEPYLYVLTNRSGQFGAAAALYPGVLSEAGEVLGEDFYLLPSSVHELLAIPKSEGLKPTYLRKILQEVNAERTAPEEQLGSEVFVYQRREERIAPCIGKMREREENR